MKTISKIFSFLLIVLSVFTDKLSAQYSCMQPPQLTLGVYDANTWAAISPTIPCTYTNLINISPVSFASGSNATTPCLMIFFNLTNANSTTNNSLTVHQGTNFAFAYSLCASGCNSFIPNSSSYSLSLFFLTPTLSTTYRLCNNLTASSFNYTIKNCYSSNSNFITSGTWFNSTANNCQTITIPANTPIGIASYTVSPAVPPTASASTGGGDLFLDTYQMSAGVYTITYFFNSQGSPTSCTATASRTILIQNPYNANWNNVAAQCTNNACVNLMPYVTGTGGGTFVGTGVTSNSFCPSSLTPGNYSVTYTVGITPQCGASQTKTIVVAPTPTANAGPTKSITCVSNPTILNGSGGGTYSWSNTVLGNNFSTNQNPTVGVAGIYSLTVSNGTCTSPTSTTQVVVNTTPPPLPNVVVSNTLNCYNNTATLNSSGSGITYTWTGPGIVSGANTASPVVNQPGNYNYTVTSTTNGCTSSSFVTVSQNTTVAFSSSVNGTITCVNNVATITANQSSYNYTWSPPSGGSILTGQFTPTVQVSGAGSYTITAQNPANGCLSVQVVSPPVNTAQPNGLINNNPTLTCNNNFTAVLNGLPGSGVSYTWSGPGIVGSPNNSTVQINAPGVYSLTVTNLSNGCVDPTPATVNIVQNNATPTITAVSQTANLVCGATSTILSGTASPVGSTYTWTSSGGTFLSGVNSSTVSVGTATTYTLISTHPVSGCTASLVYTVIPDVNTPTVNLVNTSGTITCLQTAVSTTANTIPSSGVTYTWSGPGISGPANTSVLTATLAGTYNLTVTNTNNNCKTVVSYVVSANNSPVTPNGVSSNSINCVVGSSTLSANPTPTSAVFNYTWNGPGVSGQTTPTVVVSPTSTAVYTVTVQNPNNGCMGTGTVQVLVNTTPPGGVNVNPSNVVLACPAQTAILTATASGSGNSFVWTAPPGGSILSGGNSNTVQVTAGSTVVFTVVVTGANGCTTAATSTVSPNTNAPQFNFSTNNPSITCAVSNPTVSVVLTSTVGIQSYSWSPASGIVGPANNSVAVFNQGGVYTVVVTGTNGCITSNTLSVGVNTQSPQMVSGSGTAQAITCSQSVSVINPQFTPSSDLTYTWTGSGIVGSANNSSVMVNQPGVYTVQVTNTLTGCSGGVMTVQVIGNNVPPTLTINMSNTVGLTCIPGGNTVTLTAQSNATNVSYMWSNGGTGSVITVNQTGTYSVTITELTGSCSVSGTVSVGGSTVGPNPGVTVSGPVPCGGGTTQLTAVSSPNYTYSWSGSGIVGSSNLSVLTVSAGGVYTVQVTDVQTGCVGTETISVIEATVVSQFTADPTVGSVPLVVNFTNQSVGATSYTWNFGGLGSSNAVSPQYEFTQSGTYTVTLTASNGSCVSVYTLEIKVKEGLLIPELVTPNGDNKNDVWFIRGLDLYPDNEVEIYNRWGNLVYKMKGYDNTWDGRPNQSSMGRDRLPVGTYFYIVYLKDKDNTVHKGFLKLEY